MRVKLLGVGLVGLLGLVVVSIAAAKVINGTDGDDTLPGTPRADLIRGGRGADQLFAGFGQDVVHGGPGPDTLYAVARDGQLDTLDCGPGNDVAVVRAGEQTAIVKCESVKVVPDSASPEEPGETPAND